MTPTSETSCWGAKLLPSDPETSLLEEDPGRPTDSILRWLAGRLLRGLGRLGVLPRSCRGMLSEGSDLGLLLDLEGTSETFEDYFRFGDRIGEGTFGKVYACAPIGEAVSEDDACCVKVVATQGRHAGREAKLPDEEKLRFLALFDSLQHPNIIHYKRFIQSADSLYIVMSRCMGPDLVDHIETAGGALSLAAVQDLGRQILSAIALVHSHGMMHRDIKPENFRFRDPSASILQLLDFGAAKPSDTTPKAHTVTGTLCYAAPEVFDGVYCKSCDLWSAGVVLFVLVSGQLPFQSSDVTMLRSMHRDPVLTGDCLFRGERWHQAHRDAKNLVRGLLTVEPCARLTAAGAQEQRWLCSAEGDCGEVSGQQEEDHAKLAGDVDESVSSLRRVGSSKIALADLKRSYFVWDLNDLNDGDMTPGRQCSYEEPDG